ncbi:MAG: nucleotidyltransferase family protein [Patescibacteria group bacterium]
MNTMSSNKIINVARPVLKRAGVKRSSLFGSRARAENHQGSDVDILVEMPKNRDLLDFVRLKLDLEDRLGHKVDLVTYSGLSPFIKKQVLKEHIKIL